MDRFKIVVLAAFVVGGVVAALHNHGFEAGVVTAFSCLAAFVAGASVEEDLRGG